MVRELDPTRSPGREVRRVVRHRVRDTIDLLERITPTPDADPLRCDGVEVVEAVHAARRNCKEVRALLHLTDHSAEQRTMGPVRELDRAVRDAARALAPIRDAHVAAAMVTAPLGAAAPTDRGADRHAPTIATPACREATATAIAHLRRAHELTERIATSDDLTALERGLHRTGARCRRAFVRARRRPTARRLHEWRTWNKRLWYQVRFLSATAPSVLEPLAQLLDLVGETLGEVHDLDVFLTGDRATSLTGDERAELSRRRDAQARDAVRWGATIHAEPASGFAERLVTLWEVAAGQGPEPAR